MWLDIVPFGGPEREGNREIEWPGGAFRMNVAGFDEAPEAAVEVELVDDVAVLVASLPALAMLKILAWRDKHTAHARAATDLRSLISASLTGTAFPLQPARG
jgi:predicted nucleotidyltransferase